MGQHADGRSGPRLTPALPFSLQVSQRQFQGEDGSWGAAGSLRGADALAGCLTDRAPTLKWEEWAPGHVWCRELCLIGTAGRSEGCHLHEDSPRCSKAGLRHCMQSTVARQDLAQILHRVTVDLGRCPSHQGSPTAPPRPGFPLPWPHAGRSLAVAFCPDWLTV